MRCSLGEYLQDVSVRFSLLTFGLVKRLRLCLVKMLSLGRMRKKGEKYVFFTTPLLYSFCIEFICFGRGDEIALQYIFIFGRSISTGG